MTMRNRALLVSVVLLITMSLAGCGHYTCGVTFGNGTCSGGGTGISTGGGGGQQSLAFAYFIDFAGGGMTEQQLGLAGGSFVAITDFVVPVLPVNPTAMITVNRKFLYITAASGLVYGFAINSTDGSLTVVSQNPYSVVGSDSMISDPAGQFLFVGDSSGERVTVFTINATDGTLTQVAGSPFGVGVIPAVLAVDGLGKYLYASNGSGLLQGFAVSSTGGLTAVANPYSFEFGAMSGEKTGKFLIGVSNVGQNQVHVLGIGTGGTLADVSGSPFTTTYPPMGLTVHPNGAWVYTFNGDPIGILDPIEGFVLDSSGTLTEISGSPFALSAAGGPIEQSGKFMFGLGQTVIGSNTDSTVTPYSIDSNTGGLSNSIGPLGFPGTDTAIYVVTDQP